MRGEMRKRKGGKTIHKDLDIKGLAVFIDERLNSIFTSAIDSVFQLRRLEKSKAHFHRGKISIKNVYFEIDERGNFNYRYGTKKGKDCGAKEI